MLGAMVYLSLKSRDSGGFSWPHGHLEIPVNKLETALLCWAGHGVNGLSLGDFEVLVNTMLAWSGRTHPNPCNDQHVDLVFCNDEGIFIYRPRGASKMVEVETPEEREKILTVFREDTIKIGDGVWDSKIYLSPEEVAHILRLMLKPSVLWFLLKFPFFFLRRKRFQ